MVVAVPITMPMAVSMAAPRDMLLASNHAIVMVLQLLMTKLHVPTKAVERAATPVNVVLQTITCPLINWSLDL